MVTFALIQGDTAQFYQRTSASSGLEQLQEVEQPGLRAALALSDGTLVLAAGDSLVRTDGRPSPWTHGETDHAADPGGHRGLLCGRSQSCRCSYADFADWQPYAFLDLEKEAYDLDACTDLWVTRDGDVLLLMEGQRLLLDRGSSVSDLSGMLYRPPVQCGLILAGLALGVLALTTLLWFVLWEQRRLRLPMLVRWGVLTAAAAALGTGILVRGTVSPRSRDAAEREAVSLLGSVTRPGSPEPGPGRTAPCPSGWGTAWPGRGAASTGHRRGGLSAGRGRDLDSGARATPACRRGSGRS